MKTTNATEWVVVGSWEEEGQVVCQILAEGFETGQAAEDYAVQIAISEPHWTVETATREDAEQVVSE